MPHNLTLRNEIEEYRKFIDTVFVEHFPSTFPAGIAGEQIMMVSVLDPELPALATEAAVELDLLLNGVATSFEAVHKLGMRLKETTKPTGVEGAQSLHVDTATETLLGLTFTRMGDDPATVLSQLFERTRSIATQLSGAKETAERDQLEWQRAFCLALSQLATAHRQFLFDLEPVHPDRR